MLDLDVEAVANLVARYTLLALLGVAVAMAGAAAFVRWAIRVLGPRLKPLLQALLGRWVGHGNYLSVHACVSFLIALVGLGVFFEVVEELEVDQGLARFDTALSAALARELGGGTLRAFAAVTRCGDPPVLVAVAALVAVALIVRREHVVAWSWLVTTAGGALLNRALKELYGRARPVHDHGFATAAGYSFPSGHASGSLVVYGFLCYLLVRHTASRWHAPLLLTGLLIVVLVGLSRVMLQVHYVSDVLAGWTSAGVWLALCIAGLEALRGRRRTQAVVNGDARAAP